LQFATVIVSRSTARSLRVSFYLMYSNAHTMVNQEAKDSVDLCEVCLELRQIVSIGDYSHGSVSKEMWHSFLVFMGFVFSLFESSSMNGKDALFPFFLGAERYMTPCHIHALNATIMVEILSRFYHCGKMREQNVLMELKRISLVAPAFDIHAKRLSVSGAKVKVPVILTPGKSLQHHHLN